MRKKRVRKGVFFTAIQERDNSNTSAEFSLLSGDTDILLGFAWIAVSLHLELRAMFRGNAMDSETAVKELTVLCFILKPVINDNWKLSACGGVSTARTEIVCLVSNWTINDFQLNRFFSNKIVQLSTCVDF